MADKDPLLALNEFSDAVVAALVAAGVKKDFGMEFSAIMLIVGNDKDKAPMGTSLNYNEEKERWESTPQASLSEPYYDD